MHVSCPTQHIQLPFHTLPSSAFSFQLDKRHGGCLMHSNSCLDGAIPFIGIFHFPTDQTYDHSFGASVVDQANQITWSLACTAQIALGKHVAQECSRNFSLESLSF